jgi:DNA-binding GntR family transcriptional regulator
MQASDRRVLDSAVKKLGRVAQAGDRSAVIAAHLEVHRFFYDRCGHTLLRNLWASWESRLRLFFIADHESFAEPGDVARVYEDLIRVVLTGTADEAREAIRHHVHAAPGTEALGLSSDLPAGSAG